jgi:hypothetical protein
MGINRPGREADHSPPTNAEVTNGGAIPPLSHTSSELGACFTILLTNASMQSLTLFMIFIIKPQNIFDNYFEKQPNAMDMKVSHAF